MMTNLEILKSFWQVFHQLWWIVLPVAFYYLFKVLWMNFVWGTWAGKLTWTVVEIIPPNELEKGPKPMESVYHGLAGVTTSYNAFDEYIMGMDTDKFSFELVGLEGNVHFYVRVQNRFRNLLESHIYAQYPGAEIIEVPDYMENFPKIMPNRDWDLWGADMTLSTDEAIPIKTYDKFEEDITGTMIDPMAAFIELFSTTPPGQNLAVQFVVKPLSEAWRGGEMKLVQKLAGRTDSAGKGILQHLMEVFTHLIPGLFAPVEFPSAAKKEQQPLAFRLTPGEQEQLKAIEENLGKNMFQVKVRFVYFGKREGYDSTYVSGFFGALKQFNDLNLNNLKPNDTKTTAFFVASASRLQTMKRRIFNRFRNRNTDGHNVILSTSELATLYHLPDLGVVTPSLPRVDSKKGTAPANLPIG